MQDDALADGQTQLAIALSEDSRCTSTFLILIAGAASIAVFGLIENNAAVLIGAMIVAPLILPIQGLALGAISGDLELLKRSAFTLAIGTLASVAIAALIQAIILFPTLGSKLRLAQSRP